MSSTVVHIDQVLVHWGEDLVWDERKPVIKGRDDTLKLLAKIGHSALTRHQFSDKSGVTPQSVRDHLTGIVKRSRQVMVKVTGGGSDMKRIGSHIDYIARAGRYKQKGADELELETEEGLIVRGKDARAMLKEQWMLAGAPIPETAQAIYGRDGAPKKPRREALNVILSMPGGVDREKVVAAARATAKELFANHQYVIAHHDDTDNPHAHITVKMVGFDGTRLNPRKADLEQWRIAFARQLNIRGVEAVATRRRTRLKRDKGESQAVREMKDRGVRPSREATAMTQPAAKARALENEQRVMHAYIQMAQALATSPDSADQSLAKGLKNLMQGHGVRITFNPQRKPGI